MLRHGLLCAILLYEYSFTMKALAAAALGLHWSSNMVMLYEVMLWLHYGLVMVRNVSAVPIAFHIFYQPLRSHLAYSGLKEQHA